MLMYVKMLKKLKVLLVKVLMKVKVLGVKVLGVKVLMKVQVLGVKVLIDEGEGAGKYEGYNEGVGTKEEVLLKVKKRCRRR